MTATLAEVIHGVRNKTLSAADAQAINNACGKVLSGIGHQLENAKLRKQAPKIPMLAGRTEELPIRAKRAKAKT